MASWDVENQTKVQAGILELVHNKTVLLIAHCMRMIANADKIVVLKDESVAESGSTDEVKKQNSIFVWMVDRQMSHLH